MRLRAATTCLSAAKLCLCLGTAGLTLAGCGQSVGGTRPAVLSNQSSGDLGAPSAVKALMKAVRARLEERTTLHAVTLTDLSVMPSVLWNVWNIDGTMSEEVFQSAIYTYQFSGTYDVQTREVFLVEKNLVDVQPLTATTRASAQGGAPVP